MTQANLVVLMEPCFNPAVEAQAIGRVHRLGQKRPVKVLRLVVNDSVESRIVDHVAKKYGPTNVASVQGQVNVGSIQREKAEFVREELDALYGVSNLQGAKAADCQEDANEEGNIFSASL